jgi:hypothetical protein
LKKAKGGATLQVASRKLKTRATANKEKRKSSQSLLVALLLSIMVAPVN